MITTSPTPPTLTEEEQDKQLEERMAKTRKKLITFLGEEKYQEFVKWQEELLNKLADLEPILDKEWRNVDVFSNDEK